MTVTRLEQFGQHLLFCGRYRLRIVCLVENELLPLINCEYLAETEFADDIVDIATVGPRIVVLTTRAVIELNDKLEIVHKYSLSKHVAPVSLTVNEHIIVWTSDERLNLSTGVSTPGEFCRFNRGFYTIGNSILRVNQGDYELFGGCAGDAGDCVGCAGSMRDRTGGGIRDSARSSARNSAGGCVRDFVTLGRFNVILAHNELQIVPIEFQLTRCASADFYRRYGRVLRLPHRIARIRACGNLLAALAEDGFMLMGFESRGSGELISAEMELYDIIINIYTAFEGLGSGDFEDFAVEGDLAVVIGRQEVVYYGIISRELHQLDEIEIGEDSVEMATPHRCDFLRRISATPNLKFGFNSYILGNSVLTKYNTKLELVEESQQKSVLMRVPVKADGQVGVKCDIYVKLSDQVYFSLNRRLFRMQNKVISPVEMDFAHRSKFIGKEADNKLEVSYYEIEREYSVPDNCIAYSTVDQTAFFLVDGALEMLSHGILLRIELQFPISCINGLFLHVEQEVYELSVQYMDEYPTVSFKLIFTCSFAHELYYLNDNIEFTTDEFNDCLLIVRHPAGRTQFLLDSPITILTCILSTMFIECKRHVFRYDVLLNAVKLVLSGENNLYLSNNCILAREVSTGNVSEFDSSVFIKTGLNNAQQLDRELYVLLEDQETLELVQFDAQKRWVVESEIEIGIGAVEIHHNAILTENEGNVLRYTVNGTKILDTGQQEPGKLLQGGSILFDNRVFNSKLENGVALLRAEENTILFATHAKEGVIIVLTSQIVWHCGKELVFEAELPNNTLCGFAHPYLVAHYGSVFRAFKMGDTTIADLGLLALPRIPVRSFCVVSFAEKRRYHLIVFPKSGRLLRIRANEAYGVADVEVLSNDSFSAFCLENQQLRCLSFDGQFSVYYMNDAQK